MHKRLLAALALATVLAAGGCSDGRQQAAADLVAGTTTPSASSTPSATPSPTPSPSATTTATTGAGPSTGGSAANPNPARTTTQAAPPPPPADNVAACNHVGPAVQLGIGLGMMDLLATLQNAQGTAEETAARQNVVDGFLEIRRVVNEGVGMTNDPTTQAALNSMAGALSSLATLAQSASADQIVDQLGNEGSTFGVAYRNLETVCGDEH